MLNPNNFPEVRVQVRKICGCCRMAHIGERVVLACEGLGYWNCPCGSTITTEVDETIGFPFPVNFEEGVS